MTIEFSCSHCDKVLKTSDDKAGRRAKCPQCGEPIDVPLIDGDVSDDGFDGFEVSDSEAPVSEEQSFLADSPVREEDSFLAGGDTVCPMCGASVPAGAAKCQACGETLKSSGRSGQWEPREINVGDVFSRTWEVYKANLGILIAIPMIALGIYFVGSFVVGLVTGLLSFALAQNAGGDAAIGIQLVLSLVQNIIGNLILLYLQLGGQLTYLRIVRGENPDLSEMFSGGPFLLRMFVCYIIYAIVVTLGMLALIIPGIILALMFWPYSYILVDRNLPGIESFSLARKVTSGNLLSILGLWLLSVLIFLVGGAVTLLFGLIFIVPFTYLLNTVTYAEMTSQ